MFGPPRTAQQFELPAGKVRQHIRALKAQGLLIERRPFAEPGRSARRRAVFLDVPQTLDLFAKRWPVPNEHGVYGNAEDVVRIRLLGKSVRGGTWAPTIAEIRAVEVAQDEWVQASACQLPAGGGYCSPLTAHPRDMRHASLPAAVHAACERITAWLQYEVRFHAGSASVRRQTNQVREWRNQVLDAHCPGWDAGVRARRSV